MLKKGEVKMIHKMIKQGLSKSAIARKLDLSSDTVAKYAKLPEGHIPVIKRAPSGTTVDAYLPHIAKMLEKAHELDIHIPSTSIYEEIKKMGYTGSLRWMLEIMQKHSLRQRIKDANWMSFIQSSQPYEELLKILKAFTKMYDEEEEHYTYVRYWDPRAVEIVLDMFGEDGREIWFQTVEAMYTRDTLEKNQMLKFTKVGKVAISLSQEVV